MSKWPICANPNLAGLIIHLPSQQLYVIYDNQIIASFLISSALNGSGELANSYCTPRGWHEIAEIHGQHLQKNAVLDARTWTGEIYNLDLAKKFPERDWILSRVLRLKGLEPGVNLGGQVDTFARFIYIHGTPDTEPMGIAKSHGCIRMRNDEVIQLATWLVEGVRVFIDDSFTFEPQLIMQNLQAM